MKAPPSLLLMALGKEKPADDKSKGKSKPLLIGKPDDDEPVDDVMEGKRSAARALVAAVKDGDDELVAEAFQDLYDLCASASTPEADEAEDY